MKKWICTWVLLFSVLFASQTAMADPHQVVDDFMHHLIHKGRSSAEPFLFDKMIQIPKIRETTPISGFAVLPNPQSNDTKVVVVYFKGEYGGERIAFIWELTVKNNKISFIKVIHDGTNPLIEEAKLVKEFQLKFKRDVLVPSKFPFEISGFDGFINEDNQALIMNYRSEQINGFLKVAAVPVVRELKHFKGNYGEFYKLKDGTKVLYRPKFDQAYEIMFQKNGLQYTVAIGNKKHLNKKFTVDDLIQIAESMQ